MAFRRLSMHCFNSVTSSEVVPQIGRLTATNVFLRCSRTPWKNDMFKRSYMSSKSPVNCTYGLLYRRCGAKGTQNNRLPFICCFHTSSKRNIPPIFWMFVKPVAKAMSIITGRGLRKWWQRQPTEKKQHYLGRLYPMRFRLLAAGALLAVVGAVNYYAHLQTTPVTNRERYIAFTDDQFKKIIQFEFDQQWEKVKDNVVDPSHPVYNIVKKIMRRLIDCNQDLEFFKNKTMWNVVLVESPMENAFVLPNGYIFVFTGMLKTLQNEDQLAFILAHEMSHALLHHGAEKLSMAQLLDVVLIFVMAAIWFFMPNDGLAIVTQWFYNKVMSLMLDLPYSRKLEAEADEVGLQLMAKACFDVRESSAFWSLMQAKTLASEDIDMPEFISTHPTNESRVSALDQSMEQAVELRKCSKCPNLPSLDPRKEVKDLITLIETELAAQRKRKELEGEESSQKSLPAPGQEVAVTKPAAAAAVMASHSAAS